MRLLRNLSSFLAIALTSGLLFSCNVFHANSGVPGLTYISSLGHPVANDIVWSPIDSTKILVSAKNPVKRNAQVYILDIETRKKTLLADTDFGNIWGSAWSIDGEYIALSVEGGTKGFPQRGLWMINVENNSMENFSDWTGDAVWLPNGDALAFITLDLVSDKNPRRISIYLMDFSTKKLELVYSNQDALAYSVISSSPDGKYLVFMLMFDYYSASDLFVLDLQTGVVNQLTHDGTSGSPRWSPNGNLIVYQTEHEIENKTMPSLHIILPDGSCDLEVPNVDYAFSPTWSPDGRKIAFIGEDGIYIIDTNVVFGGDIYQNLCP
jgi:Tol biopolymer transport system component